MIIDDIIDKNPLLSCEGHRLIDAVCFKINNHPLSQQEMTDSVSKWRSHHLDVESKLKIGLCTGNEPIKMTPGESGLSSFGLARFPYTNVVFAMNVFGKTFPFWFIYLGEIHSHFKYSLIILDNLESRVDFYQDKDNLTVDWGDTFYKSFNDTPKPCLINEKENYLIVIHSALKICSLISCLNIKAEKQTPSNRIQQSRLRKKKKPLISYFTLKIHAKEKREPGDKSTPKWKDARFHLCRGHFKRYTKENPLFGKYTGLYWWAPAARGNKSKGSIVKDYEYSI